MNKITFMGAGSTVFVRNVLGDCMCSDALKDWEYALYDIDATRLEESYEIISAMNETKGGHARITKHLGVENRKEALRGARFVINAIQVGLYDPCTIIDFEVPKKYGLRQTIGDTLGIGGIMRALRTIPVMDDFAKDMREVCPNALFLNYTNPMAMLSGYMQRYTGIETVGLCHSVQVCSEKLLKKLGMEDKLEGRRELIAGINHMGWLMELEEISGVSVQKRDVQTLFGADTCIEAEGLCFAYDDTTVFDSACFRLPLQGSAAITGNSGIGKSTLLKLLLGIYKPTSGRLLLRTGSEEIPLNAETRGLFAYVPQGNLLFSGTLRENLLLTAPDATEQDMETAAFVSCMDEYLPQLEHGFDTVLGESGAGLSEGQAQRVSIARAVLSGAPVLLLDEATSALDAVAEQRVLERLNALPGRVCIAITHRPAALALSDRQMVIADGKITVQTLRKEEKAWIR